MNYTDREITKLGVELYDAALAAGDRFTVADLAEQLAKVLLTEYSADTGVVHDLIVSAAHSMMGRVDRERTRPAVQASLLDDLDRAVPVADSQRIARRRMRGDDWSAHLGHVSENASRVTAAAAREYARHAALALYLSDGMDTEAAVGAWQAGHPGQVLP